MYFKLVYMLILDKAFCEDNFVYNDLNNEIDFGLL